MQRSVWNDIVNWQTRRLSNSTKYLLHASMTTPKLFLSVNVYDIKLAGKKQQLARMWKKWVKNVAWGANIILDHVCLGCTQRECKTKRENHWVVQQNVWVPYFCWSNRKNDQDGESLSQKLQRGATIWKDMPENAWNGIVWIGEQKKAEQLFRVSSPCLDDHQMKKEELENKGELSEVCCRSSLQCFYLARIGRPDILSGSNVLHQDVGI